MSKITDKSEFARGMNYKSIMRIGNTMIDVKSSIGWSFERDDESKDGYLRIKFVYPSGTTLSAKLRNRNDFYQFLIETELYIDHPDYSMPNMKKFIKDIEEECFISEDGDSKRLFLTPDEDDLTSDDEDDD